MRKVWDIFKVRVVVSLVVLAFAITLCLASTIIQNSLLKLSTYFAGMIATVIFIGLAVWLSILIKRELPTQNAPPKVVRALLSALHDNDASVRLEATKGIAELDVERSSNHEKHGELDDALVYTLEHDPDPHVRAEAAEGLGHLELEQSSYSHQPQTLDSILFRRIP